MASVSTFKSAFLSQYHVSFSAVLSGISLTNCPYIPLFFHSFFFSLIQHCLTSFLFTVSLYSIVFAAFTLSSNGSTEFLTYHLKFFSSVLIHPHNLSIPFLPFSCSDIPSQHHFWDVALHALLQTFWSFCLTFCIPYKNSCTISH